VSPTRRIVVTTGANSGIGLATAIALARAGYRSVGTVRSEKKAQVVRREAKKAGVRVHTVVLDVTDAKRCRQVIDRLRPYGVVNNAGYAVTAAVEDVGDAEARAILETMVIAPMRVARLALPHMRGRRDGRIINVSSIYGRTTTPLTGWYQAAKHALEAVSDALRIEVASDGVRVVLVEPGGFKTALWDDMGKSLAARATSRYAAAYRRSLSGLRWSQPLMGDPQSVARVIVKAMMSRAPAARYLVGYDAQLLALAEPLTPTALKDWISRMTLGL